MLRPRFAKDPRLSTRLRGPSRSEPSGVTSNVACEIPEGVPRILLLLLLLLFVVVFIFLLFVLFCCRCTLGPPLRRFASDDAN